MLEILKNNIVKTQRKIKKIFFHKQLSMLDLQHLGILKPMLAL